MIEALHHLQQNEELTLNNEEPAESAVVPVENHDSCDVPNDILLQEIAMADANNTQDGIIFVVLFISFKILFLCHGFARAKVILVFFIYRQCCGSILPG